MSLPDRMLITGSDFVQREIFLAKLKIALKSGIKLVQLRVTKLSTTNYLQLVTNVKKLCELYHAQLILNSSIDNSILTISKTTGLHLTSSHLLATNSYPITSQLVGASCHTARELAKAETLKLDYVLLSPVLTTTSHPQAKPLGWNKFAELVAKITIPVYALGGMNIELISTAQQYGACGIAGISSLWPSQL